MVTHGFEQFEPVLCGQAQVERQRRIGGFPRAPQRARTVCRVDFEASLRERCDEQRLGAIVDAALPRQLDVSFIRGALPAALPLPATSDADVAVSVTAMRRALDHKLNWMVPIPVPWPML